MGRKSGDISILINDGCRRSSAFQASLRCFRHRAGLTDVVDPHTLGLYSGKDREGIHTSNFGLEFRSQKFAALIRGNEAGLGEEIGPVSPRSENIERLDALVD